MDKQEFLKLLDKYLEGNASDEEMKLLESYYNSFQQEEQWNKAELGNSQEVESRMLQQIKEAISAHEPAPVIPFYKKAWFRIAAAATVIFVVGSTVWWSAHQRAAKPVATIEERKPLQQHLNSSHPVLMLSDGKFIALDRIADGVLVQDQNVAITKQDSQLVYKRSGYIAGDAQAALSYHTLSVPRGGHYQVVLPDGSKVWLNAASSLRFPANFTAKERRVELTGEAYFEVAKDPGKPFQVYVSATGTSSQKGALIEVLGTHFNINAYDDEQVLKTTLLEGRVKVTPLQASGLNGNNAHILLPGQQAQIATQSSLKQAVKVQTVDVEAVVAWKNNLFNFNTADIQTIMRQIARWYDVEVVYEGAMPVRSFSGKINRNAGLGTVLKILEQSGIHFRQEGKRIIVRA